MAASEFEYEYNPVKETSGGKEAERVIWTTKAFNKAVEAIKQGLPLKSNPFCGKDVQLLKPDLVYRRTQEEIEDYLHCKADPVYFASKCFLMTPEGLKPCVLRDYQIEYLNLLKENNFTILLAARQSGKCLSPTTNVIVKIKKENISCQVASKINYYYINNDIYELPLFELYNICCQRTIMWKIKYHLYKMIYKLEKWQEKKDQK